MKAERNPKISRRWGMPSLNTFWCPPIKEFVERYFLNSFVSVDPFARNNKLATHRNDLSVDTEAEYHFDARKFLGVIQMRGIVADLVSLDWPYSPRQIAECYKSVGLDAYREDTQNGKFYKEVRDAVMPIIKTNGIVLSFGWNSSGMGKERGFEIIEIMLVAHGGAHNDTICMAERRIT